MIDQALLDAADCLMSMGDPDGAAKVLRRLINERKDSQLTPRARYMLSLALVNTGRDMEAEKVLADIVSALSVLAGQGARPRRARRARAREERLREGGRLFPQVEKDFKEDPLSEKAVLGLIDIHDEEGKRGRRVERVGALSRESSRPPRRGRR